MDESSSVVCQPYREPLSLPIDHRQYRTMSDRSQDTSRRAWFRANVGAVAGGNPNLRRELRPHRRGQTNAGSEQEKNAARHHSYLPGGSYGRGAGPERQPTCSTHV
jgi:hypothetical protein